MNDEYSFSNVTIVPFEGLLDNPRGGAFHKGGPIWSEWDEQVGARHCRGGSALDTEPNHVPPEKVIDGGIWCGPIVPHFGHQIADFSMRLLPSSKNGAASDYIFSMKPSEGMTTLNKTRPYFKEILSWFRIPVENVKLIKSPTLAKNIRVYNQIEQLGGVAPTRDSLGELTDLTLYHFSQTNFSGPAFISRSRQNSRFAGEKHLDLAFEAAGVSVFHPELFSLTEQLEFYLTHSPLIFSEGSAIHCLQLFGALDNEVIVLNRRPGGRLAKPNLEVRCHSLNYIDTCDLVCGTNLSGKPAPEIGLSILNLPELQEQMKNQCIDVEFDFVKFNEAVDADFLSWVEDQRGYERAMGKAFWQNLRETLLGSGVEHFGDYISKIENEY